MTGSELEQAVGNLSDRINMAIGEFSTRIGSGNGPPKPIIDRADKEALKRLCRTLRDQRKARNNHLPANLFHEPAWDILMTLYIAAIEKKVMYVKSLVLGADAPVATSQRWIEHLANLNLVVRREDMADRRRIEVSLSDSGQRAMENYLMEISAYG